MQKNLRMSKKSSTFAPAFEEKHISVMNQEGWVSG